ncbi:amino acid ABC transporter permease [Paenarthrobacter ureafaciens]|uniref:amino acid ABC transporter permease n=1 Tax=Paenarthrobacter ureafaciens TaxID=37931 RepID=UPI0019173519|nr:amino acid ABC transporter permease [Paenarthrobacter ureafaciens]QQQ64386.1 amino acid ABC transporter permease [Paenarthrobacter ureafaciens]
MSYVVDVTQEESVPEKPEREIPPIARRIHFWRLLGAGVTLLVAGTVVLSLSRNEALNWPVIQEFMFQESVLAGLRLTIELTVISMVGALVLATIIANMRLSPNVVLRSISWAFVWFFRGIPLLVLLVLMFNFSLLYPEISIGLPGQVPIWSVPSGDLLSPFWAAVIAFVLHQSAYTSEVIRTSIRAVPTGQIEAAESLGMTHFRTLQRIVLPQALRIAIPPIANDAINLLKATSLVAFIAVSDLLYSVQQIYASNYQVVPLLVVAALWYLIIVSIMSVGQWALERRFGRGTARLGTTVKSAGGKN